MMTRWGQALSAQDVLKEYPRPQLMRGEETYVNLNGFWEYAITKSDTPPDEYDGEILVPFSPETALSGVMRQVMPDEWLYYRVKLPLTREFARGGRLLLHFGAVDQIADVYVNGVYLGSHTGGYTAFSFDITTVVNYNNDILTLRVKDYTDTSYHSRGKQTLTPGTIWYTAQSGIWQTVWLERVPKKYIERLRITPLFDENKLELTVVTAGSDLPRVCEAELMGRVERFEADTPVRLSVAGAVPWSPELPALHSFSVRLVEADGDEGDGAAGASPRPTSAKCGTFAACENASHSPVGDDAAAGTAGAVDGAAEDENRGYYPPETREGDCVTSYFAMRKYDVREDVYGVKRLFLNNAPCFHTGVLDQGYWPDGLMSAPSDAALVSDIMAMKSLGFNMLRKHIKIEPMRFYYHCDRLGIMVWQDMMNGGGKYSTVTVQGPAILSHNIDDGEKNYKRFAREDEAGRKQYYLELEEMIEQLYSCPCIALWVPFNEGWGQFDADKACQLIEKLDPTRPIDHASGWHDQKIGDLQSLHVYFRKYKFRPDKLGRAVVLSEFGGYALTVEGHCQNQDVYGYKHCTDAADFAEEFTRLYQSEIIPAKEQGLAAAVYTQLSDVEDELNGLLTYDRSEQKLATSVVREINEALKR